MTLSIRNILTVIDPTTDRQDALVRAMRIARRAGAAVHAILCCYSNATCADFAALERAEILRNELWLAHLIANLGTLADGVALTTEVHWNADWRECLAQAARDTKPDLIVKSTHTHGSIARYLLKSSDWLLLRTAQAPVLLLKNTGEHALDRLATDVLVATVPA